MKSTLVLPLLIAATLGAENATARTLSRKKRYLIFPEGSSLQLVYCLTMPVLGKSTIFTIGGTAALAWELPHDPFQPYRRPAELLHRVDNQQSANGWDKQDVLPPTPAKYKKPYYKPIKYQTLTYSPAYRQSIKRKPYPTYNKFNQHSAVRHPTYTQNKMYTQNVNYPRIENYPAITTYAHPVYHHVHRRTRRDLYSKIEKFFTAQNKDGKACLLKAVCEVSQAAAGKGTFMQEIIKAIFRVKPYDEYKDEDDYDKAANKEHNCTDIYPTCTASVWNFF